MSRTGKNSRGRQATLGAAVVAILIAVALQAIGPADQLAANADAVPAASTSQAQTAPDSSRSGSQAYGDADARIEEAVRDRRSGFMITVDGEILKLLSDDNKGSRHQRILIELMSGRTLLVAHNIDLAARVPASRGDNLRIHGQYEWNDRGGVLHWTHDDPDGRHEGGWIEHSGKRYN